MAFGATLPGVMVLDLDLLEPFRTRRTRLVAPNAMAESQLLQLQIGVIHVRLRRSVASLTRKCLVLGFGQLLKVVRMTFVTGLLTRKDRWPARQLSQCIRP